jgi:uncharacterized protein YfaS (alpha-2-macroglobulin family)
MNGRQAVQALLFGGSLIWGAAAGGATAAAPARPAAPAGETVVVPDRFLRRWDAITVFLPTATAATRPEEAMTLQPAHPGAYRWLDAKTIQFAPAEPWPPLERVVVQVGGRSFRLQTLLSPPTATNPAGGASGLDPVDEIALTFAEPISAEGLARAVSIEARALSGTEDTLLLDREDFEVKSLERAERGDAARYVLALRQPIPLGRKVVVRFRLSLDETAERSFSEFSFATAEPFRALRFGCRAQQLPALSGGARYSAEQALTCEDSDPTVVVDFSAVPAPIDTVAARNLVRLQPAVGNLEATLSGKRLELRGDFRRETSYRVTLSPLAPAPLLDTAGRALDLAAVNELALSFPRAASFLRLARPWGLVERDGPQMAPVSGRGDERVDLRIHRLDPTNPLDRSFWPLREKPIEVDEGQRPPGPGEQPAPWTRPDLDPNARQIAERIAALGSPQVSTLVDLPLRRDAGSANFGLDLAPHLRKIAGADTTGSYLVGVRRLGSGSTRSWMRIDVTDLALSTLEEARRTVFVVTSLSTAKPVAGAEVLLEGVSYGDQPTWTTLFRGATDAQGQVAFSAPGSSRFAVRRLVVSKGNDRLILDPNSAPDGFADNRWEKGSERWLQWMFESLDYRGARPEQLAHVFTERPVYRPDEPVHIKAFLRQRSNGRLAPIRDAAILFVEGPGDLVWRYPVTPSASGSVYWKFDEADLPTGSYRARFELANGDERSVEGGVSFRKEAYRLPRFEVRLDAPERAPLDQPFDVRLTATYYAGGRVAARPIEWRVTQFPYEWTPATRPGFVFSSDARYSRDRAFESTPAIERADSTDEDGGAKLPLNPTVEPTAQPRTYVVEATVIDADDQTVSATRQIVALPALLLGLKVPRYLEDPRALAPEVLVLGPDEKPRIGEPVTVRLKRRRWHSHLRASDFSDGVARYVTEVVDETLSESTIQSAAEPVRVPLAQSEPGVYIVEIEGRDRLGRTQSIAVDLFAGSATVGGDASVSWPRPATAVFQVVPDRPRYKPGEVAKLVLESPFQNGEALAVVEAPDGNRISWLPVRGGRAVFELAIEPEWTPRVPVHFLLLRGRVPGTAPVPGNATDLGRPATFGATSWLDVEPLGNRVTVELAHPSKAQPGQEVEVTIRLKKPNGEPTSGEVTLWLVDQAVMALGREQRLDPVPSFLTAVQSFLTARDTRALVFGFLPFALRPGGDEGEESKSLLDRQTVRKNFQPVPYYEPAIEVGPEGTATVKVRLPDDLTNFLVRAKATASANENWKRFGYATGKIEVRQPVVVQPSLPRFVRPGDRFTATAVGRIVDGPGGAGRTEIRAEGLTLEGPAQQALEWVQNRATRIDFPVSVPTPRFRDDGSLERTEVVVRLGAERSADKVGDAVEVRLPLRDDRDRIQRRELVELEAGKAWTLPEPSEPAREGSLRRKLLVSNEPGLVTLSAGLDFLLTYPYACTEQRLATTRSFLALRRFRDLLHLEGGDKDIARAVADTLTWLPLVQQESGLFAYWPGGSGSVSLTSWAAEFLVEAREAGYQTGGETAAVEAKALRALEQALRSDYSNFLDGESWAERSWALRALARAGKFDVGYGNELARRAQFLDLENAAGVLVAFERAGKSASEALPPLEAELWKGFATRLHQGHEIYGGLRDRQRTRSGLILPSETRTLSEMTRALVSRADSGDEAKKLAMLTDALVALGDGDGWGDTNANSSAILALSELLEKGRLSSGASPATATLQSSSGSQDFALDAKNPTGFWISTQPGAVRLTLATGSTAKVAARAEASYTPAAPGSQAAPRREGFVVSREFAVYRAGAGAAEAAGSGGVPPEKIAFEAAGQTVLLTVGDVVEDRVQVVNPEDRHYVAIVVPLAAGMEPLNPNLETAPPEAKPSKALTLEPTYAAYLDDQVAFYFDTLPKGTYDFAFRTRAQVPGTYQQPPAKAERMYDQSVVGSGAGASVQITQRP